jgi:hypothetical protein
MILALPFFVLKAWAPFRKAYHPIIILLLTGLFYLLLKNAPGMSSIIPFASMF